MIVQKVVKYDHGDRTPGISAFTALMMSPKFNFPKGANIWQSHFFHFDGDMMTLREFFEKMTITNKF